MSDERNYPGAKPQVPKPPPPPVPERATPRRFPIQQCGTVDWAAAEQAYATYVYHCGRSQTLEQLAERGGFGVAEFAALYLGRTPSRPLPADAVVRVAIELGNRWKL
jgi:hypothetical protein